MFEEKKFSKTTVKRLPLYYQSLRELENKGINEISSIELSKMMGIKPEQIRKDLTAFGNFGIKGLGYEVSDLKNNIGNILGLHNNWRVAIIGMGKLGTALTNYEKLSELGFVIAALFDVDKKKIGNEINDVRIYDFEKFIPISRRKLIDIGVIAVPDEEAQKVANVLAEAEIRGVWNFTSVKLNVPYFITVVNENLTSGIGALSFYLNQNS